MLNRIIELFERGIIALETLAGNGTPLLPAAAPAGKAGKPAKSKAAPAPTEDADDADDAPEAPAPKAAKKKIDAAALIETGKGLIRKLMEDGSSEQVKNVIKNTGKASRLTEVPEENLPAVIAELQEMADML